MTAKTTPTTPASTPQTTAQTRMDKGIHANHGSAPHVGVRACAKTQAQFLQTRLARMCVCRGWRGLSDINELQHFRRGFWRGFSVSGVDCLKTRQT